MLRAPLPTLRTDAIPACILSNALERFYMAGFCDRCLERELVPIAISLRTRDPSKTRTIAAHLVSRVKGILR